LKVLVVEAGSVLPETIEFAAGLRGNDVICAIGHKDPKTVFASQTISAGDLFSRLKIWANSSRYSTFVTPMSIFKYDHEFVVLSHRLELPIVIARFSELPKHVQAELRMRVGDGWKVKRVPRCIARSQSVVTMAMRGICLSGRQGNVGRCVS